MKKTCARCEKEKPVEAFRKYKRYDTYSAKCKMCILEERRINYWKEHGLQEKPVGTWVDTRMKGKLAEDVHLEPYNPELEVQRRYENWIKQYGLEGAMIKAKMTMEHGV